MLTHPFQPLFARTREKNAPPGAMPGGAVRESARYFLWGRSSTEP